MLTVANSQALTLTDTNGNGMSDYWEKHWNNGAVFPSTFSATADPDGDGWNNLTESVAGTNPNDPQPPTGLIQTKITESPIAEGLPAEAPKAFVISWPTVIGKQYKLLVSSDLAPGSWVLFDQPMAGTGAEIQIAVEPLNEDGTRPQRLFWRVASDDTDTDGDTLSDYEEAAKGTNPLSGDTDGDGIPDNIDTIPTISNALANPDGAGLVNSQNIPLSIAGGIIGRWDFESTLPYSPPAGSSQQPFYYPDSTANARKALAYNTFSTSPEGMVSKGFDNESGSFLSFPNDLIGNRGLYSVSFWVMIKKGAVTSTTYGNPIGLFSHHYRYPAWKYVSGVKTYMYGRYTDYVNGIWIEKKSATEELLRAGGHMFRNHDSNANLINPPVVIDNGVKVTRPLGTSDDGKWHQYTFVLNGSNTILYIDGVQVGSNNDGVSTIPNDEFSSISLGRLNGQSPTGTYPTGNGLSVTATRARFDRLRLYSRMISASEAQMLFREDIDHDGLWDVTENATRLWRDTNSDGIQNPGENNFMVSPFVAQSVDSDSDDDDLNDLLEQSIGTNIANPDSDGDLMPDGWEYQYSSSGSGASFSIMAAAPPAPSYLDPIVPDADQDYDGDGVNNLDEFRNNTDPRNKDSDGDGTNDNVEINQGSNPISGADGGQPIPPEQKFWVTLGIGDESGSKSEDYSMNCFLIDPVTGSEKRIYTLRSGGFGQYKEETKNIFIKGETYTFQIDWQSSKFSVKAATSSTPAEGPDYDYTFKVEPWADHGGVLVDSYNGLTGKLDGSDHILAVQASDVATTEAEFKQKFESKRVVLLGYDVEQVISDQISGNEANKLPSPYYKGWPNNPMMMASVAGGYARLAVKMKTPKPFASKIFTGIRKVGTSTISADAASKVAPAKSKLNLTVVTGEAPALTGFYEVVAGFDTNDNGKLDNSEVTKVFQKTPKTDANGTTVSTGLANLDKIVIGTKGDFDDGKSATVMNNVWTTDYAGDLASAFAHGSKSVPEATTTYSHAVSSTQPGLSHPVGARWNSSNTCPTYMFSFYDGSEASDDAKNSYALAGIINEVIGDNLAAIKAATSLGGAWGNSGTYNISKSRDLLRTDSEWIGFNEFGYAFGKVTFVGTMSVKSRWVAGGKIEVGDVTYSCSLTDLYDFSYFGTLKARQAALVQAGHATLATGSESDAGKIFFTRDVFNGTKSVDQEF